MGGFQDPYFQESGKFSAETDFVKSLTNNFRVEFDGGRLGLITYGLSAHVSFDFNTFLNPERLRTAIGEASPPDNGGNLKEALEMSKEYLFSLQSSSDKPSSLVVITAGKSTGSLETISQKLKKLGVEIFCVGVGEEFDRRELNTIASRPLTSHVFIANFGELESIASLLSENICQGKLFAWMYGMNVVPGLHVRCGKYCRALQ